jgi:hypothetical protein
MGSSIVLLAAGAFAVHSGHREKRAVIVSRRKISLHPYCELSGGSLRPPNLHRFGWHRKGLSG